MDDLVFPKLEWPFQPQNHKDADFLVKEVLEWGKKFFSVVVNDNELKDLKFTYFSSRVWNYGSYERVLAISKFATVMFFVDDYYYVKCATWTKHQFKRLLEIACNEEIVKFEKDSWIEAAFSDSWQCISRLGTKEWKQRFLESLNMWFSTMVLEMKYRKSKKIPSLVEYITLRPFSVGAEFCFSFIEFASNKYLESKHYSNPMFQALLQQSRYVLFATNDLYSYRKEVENEDVMNIVMVYQNEYGLSPQEAIYKTVNFIMGEMDKFLCYKEQLCALFPEEFDFYMHALGAMIRGNYDFHLESKRY